MNGIQRAGGSREQRLIRVPRLVGGVLATIALVAAACGSSTSSPAGSAAPPARPVWSLSQYGSQSETVTLTSMFGLAATNSSTIACWLVISAGSPQIEYSREAGGPE